MRRLALEQQSREKIMSKEHPLIVYVGDAEIGQDLSKAAEARGWHVFITQDAFEALAITTVYYPDIAILDVEQEAGREARFHLGSLDSIPMLLLGTVSSSGSDILPSRTPAETLLDFIAEILREPLRE